MCLSIEGGADRSARGRQETSRLCGEAQKALTQVKLAWVMVSSVAISVLLPLSSVRCVLVGGADSKLRSYLIQGVLRIR